MRSSSLAGTTENRPALGAFLAVLVIENDLPLHRAAECRDEKRALLLVRCEADRLCRMDLPPCLGLCTGDTERCQTPCWSDWIVRRADRRTDDSCRQPVCIARPAGLSPVPAGVSCVILAPGRTRL